MSLDGYTNILQHNAPLCTVVLFFLLFLGFFFSQENTQIHFRVDIILVGIRWVAKLFKIAET